MSSPSSPNLARRPSLADSIEVTVEEHTAHTVLPSTPSPFNLGSYQFPSSSAFVYPAPPPLPLPFLGRRASLAESIEVTIEQTMVSSYSPPQGPERVLAPVEEHEQPRGSNPPAYRFPDVASPNLLSFYPSGGITRPKPRPTSTLSPNQHPADADPSGTTRTSITSHSSSRKSPPPPPSYTRLPRTSAERAFYLGFLFPPLWLAGAWRLSHSAIPSHLRPDAHNPRLDPEAELGAAEAQESWWAAVGLGAEGGEGWQERAPRVDETVALWRAEEVVWARRCAQCFGGAVVMGVMVATVVSNVFR